MTSLSRIIFIPSGFVDSDYMGRVKEMAAQYGAELVVADESSKWPGNDIDKVWIDEGFELGQIDRFRIISSPKLEEPEMHRAVAGTKRGRQLNSRKIRRSVFKSPEFYRGGEKELERGARLYVIKSQTNGYPLVQILSKRFYDQQVELSEG